MEPQVATELMTTNKSVKEFVFFVVQEMEKLNTLEGVEVKDPQLLAIEVQARALAYNKIKDILAPMLEVTEQGVKFNNQEYIA